MKVNEVLEVGAVWISRVGVMFAVWVLIAIGAVYGARRLRLPGSTPHQLETICRTLCNAVFFLFVLYFIYQTGVIASYHKTLEELNLPYYEGGQGAFPVASAGELEALTDLTHRAIVFGVVALLVFLLSCGLQYFSMARYMRSARAKCRKYEAALAQVPDAEPDEGE